MRRALQLFALFLLVAGCVTTQSGGAQKGTTPQRLQAQLDLARGYLEQGDIDSARRPLEHALKIDPSSSEAHVLMATVYLVDGDKRLAENEYRQALRHSPRDAMAHNNYGTFLFAEGRYKEAREQLKLAANDPKYGRRALAYENLGITELRLGDVAEAEQAFLRGLMLNTSLARSQLELANLYFAAGDFPNARTYFDRYNAIAQPSARSLWLGVRLSRVLGSEDELASYAIALKNLYPNSEEYRLYQDRQW